MTAQHGGEATKRARSYYHSGTHAYHNMCLKAVHEYLDIGAYYPSAKEAWDNNHDRVFYKGIDAVPFGAPLWTRRRTGDVYGHIVLAGGRFRKSGERICWTTDQFGDGRITPVPVSFFVNNWNHEILGWARSLNGVRLPYL